MEAARQVDVALAQAQRRGGDVVVRPLLPRLGEERDRGGEVAVLHQRLAEAHARGDAVLLHGGLELQLLAQERAVPLSGHRAQALAAGLGLVGRRADHVQRRARAVDGRGLVEDAVGAGGDRDQLRDHARVLVGEVEVDRRVAQVVLERRALDGDVPAAGGREAAQRVEAGDRARVGGDDRLHAAAGDGDVADGEGRGLRRGGGDGEDGDEGGADHLPASAPAAPCCFSRSAASCSWRTRSRSLAALACVR